MLRDRYGISMTMSPAAAEVFEAGIALAQCYDPAFLDAFEAARAADPSACLPPLAIAVLGAGLPGIDVAGRVAEAEALSGRVSDRERSLVALTRLWVQSGVLGVEAAARKHLARWPCDVLALTLLIPGLGWSGRPGAAEAGLALVDELAPAYGQDWWMLGLRAFAEQERGRYDEAFALAERSLALQPRSVPAAHARAHVHYETGDHRAGHAWLAGWWAAMPPTSGYHSHLSWHLALHELAEGDLDSVLSRYRRDMGPGPANRSARAVLIDGASLAWRCRLRDVPKKVLPGGPVLDAVAPVSATLPNVFLAMHVVLAAAAAEDADGLGALASRMREASTPYVGELVAPLADAMRAYVERRYTDAADALTVLNACSNRLGGSHAQREVVEDTLLAALLHADDTDQARELLQSRLDRRSSPYEQHLMDSLPSHQAGPARTETALPEQQPPASG